MRIEIRCKPSDWQQIKALLGTMDAAYVATTAEQVVVNGELRWKVSQEKSMNTLQEWERENVE